MRIGIMSMQRVANYGSYLQAYGLKKTIESLGYEVQFVDYQKEGSLVKDEVHVQSRRNAGTIRRVFRLLSPKYRKWRERQIQMNKTFAQFEETYRVAFLPTLDVQEKETICPELDTLIIGSDEVFNCTQAGDLVGYSRQLFGEKHRAKNLISYAASFGSTTQEKLEHYGIAEEIGNDLQAFHALSVRDKNSWAIVNNLTSHKAEEHIDPVLLYDFPEVEDIQVTRSNYIIVYAYAGRISDEEAKVIRKVAQEQGKKILCLGFYQPFCDEYILASPLEVLAYVKNADCVITDTFHGTVFSIKYQVPFATIIRESNKEKLGDLLQRFELQDRQVHTIDEIDMVVKKTLPKEHIQQKLRDYQKEAMEYLRTNI